MITPTVRESTLGRRMGRLLDPRQRRTPMPPVIRFLVGMFSLVLAFVLGLGGMTSATGAKVSE